MAVTNKGARALTDADLAGRAVKVAKAVHNGRLRTNSRSNGGAASVVAAPQQLPSRNCVPRLPAVRVVYGRQYG